VTGQSYLNVPEPAWRAGDAPEFNDVDIPVAGAVSCPPPDQPADQFAEFAEPIIRVLDPDARACGDWAGSLSTDAALRGLKNMMTVRALDARMVIAQRQGKTSFYMQCLGEEAVACAFQSALQPGDMNFPTYRQQGLLVTAGYPIGLMMNQVYSNEGDPLLGRQMPVFYSSREYGFFSISGNLGTQFVQAVGWAMGAAIDGKNQVAAGWIGDGATAESDFHSALVFASTFTPPVVLNIVNNQWAISTFQGIARGSSVTFAARGLGFGIPALRVDGNDYLAVHAVSKWAIDRARSGLGPTLIEHVTYRDGPHSTSDDPSSYRPKEEADGWPLGDPIERLKRHLISEGAWSEDRHAQAQAEIEAFVLEEQKRSEALGTLQTGRRPSAKAIFDDVYANYPLHLRRQRQEAGV
jgi:2-oxoisovalerate dehydrogenase E1 component alpha subunit